MLLVGLSLSAVRLPAADLTVPLRLPMSLLREALQSDLGMERADPADVFRQGDCRYMRLDRLSLEPAGDQLVLTTHAALKYGPEWFGGCFGAVDWTGQTRFQLSPYITEDYRLRYRVLETRLYDEQGKPSTAANLVWKLISRTMQPRLESFQVDLKPPRAEIAEVVHKFVSPAQAEELDDVLASAHAAALYVEGDSLIVPMVFQAPDHYLTQRPQVDRYSEAPLSDQELTAFTEISQAWDAFLVHVVKSLGLDTRDPEIRVRLLELLLESRYRIVGILAGEIEPGGTDPTRELFIDTWTALHDLITEAGRRGQLQGRLLPYLSFLSAGDALFFLDHTAPGLGIEISADGLRRLARTLRPGDSADPLDFDWNLDPFLQDLFETREPLPPTSSGPQWLEFLIHTAQAETLEDDVQQLAQRLKHWIPAPKDLDAYRTVVATLLDAVRAREVASAKLNGAETRAFQHLVPATALIESCWRQYKRENDQVTHVRSSIGAIGMMQINPSVWRGIFDVDRLKTDAGYNAYAGTRILMRYLLLYARPVAARTGSAHDVARASYAAYNAGPRAADRFLKADLKPRLRQIDEKFWRFYEGLMQGGTVDLQSCAVVPPAT